MYMYKLKHCKQCCVSKGTEGVLYIYVQGVESQSQYSTLRVYVWNLWAMEVELLRIAPDTCKQTNALALLYHINKSKPNNE